MEDMKTEGAGWLDSAAARYCRELSKANATLVVANAQLEERNAELRDPEAKGGRLPDHLTTRKGGM
jgi:hypothetical protein